MYPKIATLGPFHVGSWTIPPIDIHSYGFMLMWAFLAGIFLTLREAKRKKFPPEEVIDLSLIILIFGIIFARLLYVLLNISDYLANPHEMLLLWRGGLSFHGGAIGAVLGGFIYARRKKRNFWQLADLFTPALPLAYAIAKIGCLLNGCCYGYPTSLPWGLRFYSLTILGATTAPSHPAQLYDSLANIVLFFIIRKLKMRDQVTGALFLEYLIGCSIIRIFVEVFRRGVTAVPLFGSPVTQAQAASAIVIIVAVIILRRWTKREKKATKA